VPKDPILQSQVLLRRAGSRLRGYSLETTRLDGYDESRRDEFYETGRQQVVRLARRIEAASGTPLATLRVLDFGCGVGRMTLPFAERCAHAYGVDISPAVLREADAAARSMGIGNVEWLPFERLGELDGRYDVVVSMYVFQHIASREGERIFTNLVRGLTPGGVGAIDFTIRPVFPLRGWWRRVKAADRTPRGMIRALDYGYTYQVMYSYSLNRLGRILDAEGIYEWHVKWHTRADAVSYETATLVFRKPEAG
jgi:2-polyprenyl-3-methyl-5-hydroxy-6-metoxy-1,4-benzoquinol methylase